MSENDIERVAREIVEQHTEDQLEKAIVKALRAHGEAEFRAGVEATTKAIRSDLLSMADVSNWDSDGKVGGVFEAWNEAMGMVSEFGMELFDVYNAYPKLKRGEPK